MVSSLAAPILPICRTPFPPYNSACVFKVLSTFPPRRAPVPCAAADPPQISRFEIFWVPGGAAGRGGMGALSVRLFCVDVDGVRHHLELFCQLPPHPHPDPTLPSHAARESPNCPPVAAEGGVALSRLALLLYNFGEINRFETSPPAPICISHPYPTLPPYPPPYRLPPTTYPPSLAPPTSNRRLFADSDIRRGGLTLGNSVSALDYTHTHPHLHPLRSSTCTPTHRYRPQPPPNPLPYPHPAPP